MTPAATGRREFRETRRCRLECRVLSRSRRERAPPRFDPRGLGHAEGRRHAAGRRSAGVRRRAHQEPRARRFRDEHRAPAGEARREASRAISPRRSSPRCRPNDAIAKVEIAGPGFINFFLSPAAYRQEIAGILDRGDDYGRGTAGAGRARRRRIRLGQSDRSAARRPRPRGGDRRLASRACSTRTAGRSCASSTTTTPACRSTTSRCRCRRAVAASSPTATAGRRTAIAATTSRMSRARTSSAKACTRTARTSSAPATSTISTRSAASRSLTCAASRMRICSAFGVELRRLLPRILAVRRRQGRGDDAPAGRRGPHLRGRRRAVAAHDRVRRRQGPRDAEVGRHRSRTSCRTSPITFRSGSAATSARSPSSAPIITARSRA